MGLYSLEVCNGRTVTGIFRLLGNPLKIRPSIKIVFTIIIVIIPYLNIIIIVVVTIAITVVIVITIPLGHFIHRRHGALTEIGGRRIKILNVNSRIVRGRLRIRTIFRRRVNAHRNLRDHEANLGVVKVRLHQRRKGRLHPVPRSNVNRLHRQRGHHRRHRVGNFRNFLHYPSLTNFENTDATPRNGDRQKY